MSCPLISRGLVAVLSMSGPGEGVRVFRICVLEGFGHDLFGRPLQAAGPPLDGIDEVVELVRGGRDRRTP
jgi:hypothetical protein